MVGLCIGEAALVLLLGWLFYIQFRRNQKLERIATVCVDNAKAVSDVIKKADEKLSSDRLKEAFEKDDDTGIFFEQMKEIQEILNNFKLDGKEEVAEQ